MFQPAIRSLIFVFNGLQITFPLTFRAISDIHNVNFIYFINKFLLTYSDRQTKSDHKISFPNSLSYFCGYDCKETKLYLQSRLNKNYYEKNTPFHASANNGKG